MLLTPSHTYNNTQFTQKDTFEDVPNMVRTASDLVDFINAESHWTRPFITNDFPVEFFNKQVNTWRPKLIRLPQTECTAELVAVVKTNTANFKFRQHIRSNSNTMSKWLTQAGLSTVQDYEMTSC